ncbi:methyl-accepting chemotaxis protein [Oceaniserpentilla sp. 4NH20-0058]|uniref:methyl-accepting chemotaxis protein n=1 Tax=Oceaniserpentilla sp. 4NH20-0058 TaxID=3127660 RepID=UPI003101C193
MNGLLAPAIALMNRLSYAKKFGVISVIFFIPLIMLSFIIINQTYNEIEKAKLARGSLSQVSAILGLGALASPLRDYSSVISHYSPTGLKPKVDQLTLKLQEAIGEISAKYPDTFFTKEINKRKDQWLKKLSVDGMNKQPTIIDQFKNNSLIIDDIWYLTEKTAQQSGLMQDFDINVQLLLKLALTEYRTYLASMGFAHTVGLYSLSEVNLTTTTYDALNSTFDDLNAILKRMKQNHRSILGSNKKFQSLYQDIFKVTEKNIEDLQFKIDNEMISAMSITTSGQKFSEYYQGKLPPFFQVGAMAAKEIDRILTIRIDELTQKLITVVVSIISAMLLIVYLYAAFFWSVRSTVGRFYSAARKISQGNMTIRVKKVSQDEMGELTSEFNTMVEQIHSLLQAVHKTADEVGQSMKLVGRNADQSNKAAGEQLHQTEQVASAMTELASTSEEVNRQSDDAAQVANDATQQAGSANEIVTQTLGQINNLADEIVHSTDVINQLSENSSNIANMLAVIKGIAEQTNLLALNAAIEAARAGEQGRGFAVVADEVRTLASRTQTSAQEIEEVMTSIQTGINDAVGVMGRSHEMAQNTVESSSSVRTALEEIVNMIQSISDINSQISVSADEQTKVARGLDENVVKINDLGRATVGDSEHTVKAIQEVVALTHSLQEKLQKFQV